MFGCTKLDITWPAMPLAIGFTKNGTLAVRILSKTSFSSRAVGMLRLIWGLGYQIRACASFYRCSRGWSRACRSHSRLTLRRE